MDLDKLKSNLEKEFDYFRITKAKTQIKYVNAKNKEIKNLNTDKYEGISIFGVRKGKSAFVSTNSLQDKDLIPKLKKLTKIGEKTNYLDLIGTKKEDKKIKIGKKSSIPFEDRIKLVIKESNTKDCSVNELISVERAKLKQIITNYKDIEIDSIYSVLQNNITVHEKDNIRGYRNRWGAQTNIDKKLESLNQFVNENKKEANEQLSYKSGLKGVYDVIIDPKLSHLLAHESIGHACEADLVYNKESNLKLGQKLSDYKINVIDNPTIKDSFGSFEYDDEGTKATKRTLIRDGVVNEFLTDLKYAKKLNISLNGAARAESYSKIPIPRMSDTGFAKGDISLKEMKEDMKTGLILEGGSGGQVDPTTGTFQFGVMKATLVNKSKEEKYVNTSFSGNISTDLFKIEGVSKEWEYSNEFVGHCGKSGQQVPVSGFGPYIKFKGIRF